MARFSGIPEHPTAYDVFVGAEHLPEYETAELAPLPETKKPRFGGILDDQPKPRFAGILDDQPNRQQEEDAYDAAGGGFLPSVERGFRNMAESYHGAEIGASALREKLGIGGGMGPYANPDNLAPEAFEEQKRSDAAASLLEQQKKLDALPRNPAIARAGKAASEAYKQNDGIMAPIKTVGAAFSELAESPDKLGLFTDLAGEQAANVATTIAGAKGAASLLGAAGVKKAVPVIATSLGAGAGSSSSTFGPNVAEGLQQGLPPEEAINRAAKMTAAQTGVDMLTAGFVPFKIGPSQIVNIPSQLAIQMAGGAGGEYLSRASVGEKADPGNLTMEAILEAIGLPGDVASAMVAKHSVNAPVEAATAPVAPDTPVTPVAAPSDPLVSPELPSFTSGTQNELDAAIPDEATDAVDPGNVLPEPSIPPPVVGTPAQQLATEVIRRVPVEQAVQQKLVRLTGDKATILPAGRRLLAQAPTAQPIETPNAQAITPPVVPVRTPPPARVAKPADLLRFIAKSGGIMDQGGELKDSQKFIPGAGNLIRKNGLPLDQVRELVSEAGYGPFETTADLLSAIDENVRGTKLLSGQDMATAAIDQQMTSYDPVKDQHDREIAEDEAFAEAERAAIQAEVPVTPAAVDDIPFDAPAPAQSVIPGAEAISDRQLAERKMQGRKKAAVTQAPVDDGLFDVAGRTQTDLLAKPVKEKPVRNSVKAVSNYEGLDVADPTAATLRQLYAARKKTEKAFADDNAKDAKDRLSDEAFTELERYAQDVEAQIEAKEAAGEKVIPAKKYSVGNPQTETPEFKNWFGKSKATDARGKPLRVYHGSGADISEFSYDFTNQGFDALGSGFYFTEKPEEASDYTERKQEGREEKLGGSDSPNVAPVYLAIQNPLNAYQSGNVPATKVRRLLLKSPSLDDALSNWGDVEFEGKSKVLNEAIKAYSSMGDKKSGTLHTLNNIANDFFPDHIKEFNKAVRDVLGYDGVVNNDPELGIKHWVAWFPEQIKSATGNRGTFDPTDSRINYAASSFTPKAQTTLPELMATIQKEAMRINPKADVQFALKLFGEGENLIKSGQSSTERQEVAGAFTPIKNLVEVSLNIEKFNPQETAYHELWHSLETVLTPQEQAALKKAYPGGKISHDEQAAYAFGDWASRRYEQAHSPAVKRIFAKIKAFLQSVGRAIKGQGFKSVDDLFEKGYSGELGSRKSVTSQLLADAGTLYSTGKWGGNLESLKENYVELKTHLGNYNKAPIDEQYGFVLRSWFQSIEGMMGVLQEKHNNSPTINLVRRQLFSPTAEAGTVGRTYYEEIENKANTAVNRLGKVVEPVMGDKKKDNLLEIVRLVRNPKENTGTDAIHKAAGDLTALLKDWTKYLTDSGLKFNPIEGYFPRIYDRFRILSDQAGFLKAAEKAYVASGTDPKEAATSAQAWLDRLKSGDDIFDEGEFKQITSQPPMPNSLKARTLSKEADTIMEAYLINDPLVALSQHFATTARKAAYNKRFGPEKMTAIKTKLTEEGNQSAYAPLLAFLQHATNVGAYQPSFSRGLSDWVMAASTMAFMDRSAISSLTELVSAAISTGSLKAGMKQFGASVREFIKPGSVEDIQDISELLLGTTGELANQMIMDARMDAGIASPLSQKLVTRYYKTILLQRLTEAERKGAIVANRYWIKGLASDVLRKRAWEKSSRLYLKEMGIPDSEVEGFAEWVQGSKLDLAATAADTKYAEMYRVAMQRRVNRTVINTTRAERNFPATHPWGRILFHLQGYMYGFTKQVLLRNVDLSAQALGFKLTGTHLGIPKFKRLKSDMTLTDRVRMGLLPLGMTMTVPVLINAIGIDLLRELVTDDPDRDPKKKKPEPGDPLWWARQASRATLFGAFDPFINAGLALRYQKDPVASLSGAYVGGLSETIGNFIKLYAANSVNTGTAERNAAKSAYNIILDPTFDATVLALAPKTILGNLLSFVLIQGASNPTVRSKLLDGLGVPKKGKTDVRADIPALNRIIAQTPKPATLAKFEKVLTQGTA